jgi:PAS domain S-box-containing protein
LTEVLFDNKFIEAAPYSISAYNAGLKIILWNSACEERFGIKKETILGKDLLTVFPYMNDDYRVNCIRNAFKGKSYFFENIPYRFHKGFYTQYITPLQVTHNRVDSVVNIVHDLGQSLPLTKEQLLESLQVKRQLAV